MLLVAPFYLVRLKSWSFLFHIFISDINCGSFSQCKIRNAPDMSTSKISAASEKTTLTKTHHLITDLRRHVTLGN